MAIVDDLMRIRDWLQTNVCDQVRMKLPNDGNGADGYEYELVKPTAFVLFTPTKDRLPPSVRAPVPSVCVRLENGEHRPTEGLNEFSLVLHFCTWNPGIHGKDNFTPINGAGMQGYNQVAEASFRRTADGWQDVFGFIDTALRAIENAGYIDGMRVKTEDGIKYGMNDYDLDEFYPYWPAWISFTVQAGNIRAEKINELL